MGFSPPTPTPKISRPPDSASSVEVILAAIAGVRSASRYTAVPSRIRLVIGMYVASNVSDFVDGVVEGDVIARPHRVEAERLDAPHQLELLGRRLDRELHAEAHRQRGKASFTPPSTVRVQPVVLAERSEARNSTASATSSGRMRRAEEVALAIEVLELVDGDALGAGALAPDLLRPELGVAEDGVGVHDVGADAVRPTLERQHLGELGLGRLGRRVRREVLARRHHVLGGDEDEARRRGPGAISTRMASRATRKWPVEFTANERSQSASAMRSTGRRMRDAGVGDQDVEATVGEHGRLEGLPDRRLAGDVHADPERAPAADRLADLVRHPARGFGVDVGDRDVRALGRQALRDGAADAGSARR